MRILPLNKRSVSLIIFVLLSIVGIVVIKVVNSNQTFDVRSRASGFSLQNKKMIYSEKYRMISNGYENEMVVLGYYEFFTNGKLKVYAIAFNANKNAPATRTDKKHGDMNAPYCVGECPPGPFYKPTSTSEGNYTGTWQTDGDILTISLGNNTHEWKLMDQANGYYRINKDIVGNSSTINYSNTDGFAYLTDSIKSGKISKANLLNKYSTDALHNNFYKATPEWTFQNSTLYSYNYKPTSNPNVVSFSTPTTYASDPEILVQSSMLFNDSPISNLMFFIDQGNDINKNGSLDEGRHSYQVLGVKEGNLITKMVGVEYFSDSTKGYPILSIFRYYKPTNTDTTIRLDSDVPVLTKGSAYRFAWKSTNPPSGAYVGNIQLFKGPVFNEELLSEPIHYANGFFDWSLSNDLPSYDYYKVNIILYADFLNGRTRVPIAAVTSRNFEIK